MYQALYRKYRPVYFKDVVGQDAIVQTLQNAIKLKKISHAYLFSGPRGTGKTSLAKIFARTINCCSPNDGEACGNCPACNSSFLKECIDIIEIDAASNNGVDEIRELRSKVHLSPSELTYKVYIIDEVHMLSIGAFNALLKTLEEPPHHAIFILATTDPHKVPNTIVSRCQCYSFKKIAPKAMVGKLKEVVEKENINIETNVLSEISSYADGGLRDGLGMLDKLSSYTTDKITIQDFQSMNGLLGNHDLEQLYNVLFNSKDGRELLTILNEWYMSGKDFVQVTDQLINYLSEILKKSYFDSNESVDRESLYLLLDSLNKTLYSMKNSGNVKILLELSLLEFVTTNDLSTRSVENISLPAKEESKPLIEENATSTTIEEENILPVVEAHDFNESTIVVETINDKIIPDISLILNRRINNTFAEASKEALNLVKNLWERLNDKVFDPKVGYLACMLLDGYVRAASNRTVLISYKYNSSLDKAWENIDKLTELFNSIAESNYYLAFLSDDEWLIEKKKYVENLSKHITYSYQEEELITTSVETAVLDDNINDIIEENLHESSIIDEAKSLFGDLVEIVE